MNGNKTLIFSNFFNSLLILPHLDVFFFSTEKATEWLIRKEKRVSLWLLYIWKGNPLRECKEGGNWNWREMNKSSRSWSLFCRDLNVNWIVGFLKATLVINLWLSSRWLDTFVCGQSGNGGWFYAANKKKNPWVSLKMSEKLLFED